MTREETPIDWKKVDDLLISGCMGTEVAAFLGVHPDTLYKRVEAKYKMNFSAYLAEKRSKGESILRSHQYAKALGLTDKGDNTLLIWLGKNRLQQRENLEAINIPPNDKALTELTNEIKSLKGLVDATQSKTNTEL